MTFATPKLLPKALLLLLRPAGNGSIEQHTAYSRKTGTGHTDYNSAGLMSHQQCTSSLLLRYACYKGKGKGKVHPCTGTEALYRPYGPQGE
jgi:hypothetical protein